MSVEEGSFRKSVLLHFQYGRQAAFLNFAFSAYDFRMLGPVEFKI
jgi:hypothetical protein